MFFPRKSIDRGVHHVAPGDITDDRILTAEELSLQNEIAATALVSEKKFGFTKVDILELFSGRSTTDLAIVGQLTSSVINTISLDALIRLSPTFETGVAKRLEYFYSLVFVARVGASNDADLGVFSRQYDGATITEIRENTQRLRVFHLIISSYAEVTLDTLKVAIAIPEVVSIDHSRMGSITIDKEEIPVEEQLPPGGEQFPPGEEQLPPGEEAGGLNGFAFGGGTYKGYAVDSNLVTGTYPIILDSLNLARICVVHHRTSSIEQGFQYEANSTVLERSWESAFEVEDATSSAHRLMAGYPLKRGVVKQAVLNLIQGATNTGSTNHPGMTSDSPNGSTAIANDQRTFFSNEARLQINSIQYVTAVLDNDGNVKISATNNTNAPGDTSFSTDPASHHVYDLDGLLLDSLGSFTDLGNANTVSWFAGQNAQVQAGQTLIFQPGINYPAGSGFNISFDKVTAVYLNGVKLDDAALLNGRTQDIEAYQEPPVVGGEAFFVVWGTERSALHYIYKKISVTTDAKGVAIVPNTEKGCFAFIEGVAGRQDRPAVNNLAPATSYNALVYYPPRSSQEVWQLVVDYTPYQGLGSGGLSLLGGGKIISEPQYYSHSQGGGLSVHRSDSSLVHSPISFHLPSNAAGYPSYKINHPVRLKGESYPGPVSFRNITMLHGQNLSMPQVGKTVRFEALGINAARSLNVRLVDENSNVYGYRTPYFQNEIAYYQHICTFLVEKDGKRAMVVITHNDIGNKDCPIDYSAGAAIDVFAVD